MASDPGAERRTALGVGKALASLVEARPAKLWCKISRRAMSLRIDLRWVSLHL